MFYIPDTLAKAPRRQGLIPLCSGRPFLGVLSDLARSAHFGHALMQYRDKSWLGGVIIVFTLVLSTGCGKQPEVPGETNHVSDSTVLARVNGEAITDTDVDLTLQRTFSSADLMMADDGLRLKVLDSLIASRAMKQSVQADMTPEEVDEIRHMARAYEEELFVREYLQRHATPEPVTTEMLLQYYNENPDRFGAETLRDFELLKAPVNLDEATRDKLLNAVADIRGEPDWPKSARNWAQQYGLHYQKGRSRSGLLHRNLDEALQRLEKGETSEVLTIDGQIHLVRLQGLSQTPPKPLSEVSAEIRKTLAPLQLKKAIKRASWEARKQAKVELED